MCGIAGWFSRDPIPPESRASLDAMVGAIAHRGPDGHAARLLEHAALGHARLAIIDLAGGNQPMSTPDNSATIVFNGEIYNYRELRQSLIARGVDFRTHSDTEVILHLYQREGLHGFGKLRGMYAFALWDERQRIGILARDPLGIKPLFVAESPTGTFEFASEAKAILSRSQRGAEMDTGALHLLMNFRYLPDDRTMFKGIKQVPAGVIIEWRTNGSVTRHAIRSTSYEEHPDTLGALRESVRAHLTADVEVGAYLSGGIDSAAIVALANAESGTKLRTFTLDIGDDPDEAKNASRTAELLGNTNLQSPQPDGLGEALAEIIWNLEVPKVNALQVRQLAKLTRRHVKVALSGLGGDELFFGYNAHRILHLASSAYRWMPRVLCEKIGNSGVMALRALSGVRWSESERALVMLSQLGNWPRVYGVLRNLWDAPSLRTWIYGPRMLDTSLPDAFETLEEFWPRHQDPVVAMAEFEWHHKMVNDLLWHEDRLSMAEGLEVRVPFVDAQLAHHARQFDRQTLMPHGRPKGYLRDVLRSILPDEILARPKSGFQVNAPEFFHRHLRCWEDPFLSEDYIRNAGLFNPAFVRTILRYGTHKRTRWHYFMLYLILGTHLWVELFEKRAWPQPS
jgi:asparagine synthase (glutamine-hydrolysing)